MSAMRIPRYAKPGWEMVLITTRSDVQFPSSTLLTLGPDRQLRDKYGTVYAAEDELMMTDKSDRAGVGLLSLSAEDPFNTPAKHHDFKYSCKSFQDSHSRLEADEKLREEMLLAATSPWRKWLAKVFYKLARGMGGGVWENDANRNEPRKFDARDGDVD